MASVIITIGILIYPIALLSQFVVVSAVEKRNNKIKEHENNKIKTI